LTLRCYSVEATKGWEFGARFWECCLDRARIPQALLNIGQQVAGSIGLPVLATAFASRNPASSAPAAGGSADDQPDRRCHGRRVAPYIVWW
jgi:hypothetical protein